VSAAGTEKPTTDETGRALGDLDAEAPAGGRRSDAHDLGGCLSQSAIPREVKELGVGLSLHLVEQLSQLSETVRMTYLCWAKLPPIDNEVFVDRGDSGIGVSGAVEHAGVVSVADEEGTSVCSGDVRIDTFNLPSS